MLSKMARDYLAIQGSLVASERAFLSAAILDDLQRNKTESKAFGNLQVLKFDGSRRGRKDCSIVKFC
jgi:hAT family C-terminal dimerisation region